ncbi:hypothetical protein ACS0TY_000346 [Phlomoides rotata]
MDFHMLSRRDLQALCKRNKIPANITNVAMAESLKALEFVEGMEEFSQSCQSETAQSSIESPLKNEVTSPLKKKKERSVQIKIPATMNRLCLNLDENKSNLMQNSTFYNLIKVKNNKECSGNLLKALCSVYDNEAKVFKFNDQTSVGFCVKEVAKVLGMEDKGVEYEKERKNTDFPQFVFELKAKYVSTSAACEEPPEA